MHVVPVRTLRVVSKGGQLLQRCHSHIGRAPLKFASDNVRVETTPFVPGKTTPVGQRPCRSQVTVAGPLGQLSLPLHPFVRVDLASAPGDPKTTLSVSVDNARVRTQRMLWGTTRALLANMIEGVSEGFSVPLRLVGVGYRAFLVDPKSPEAPAKATTTQGNPHLKLSLKLGYSHPIMLDVPAGVAVSVPAPQRIIVQGIDKAAVTQFAAKIRAWRKPEPYNQKGVFVGDETIKKKEGKKR